MLGLMAIVFFVLLAIGAPVAVAMGLTGAIAVVLIGDIPPQVIAQRFVTGVDSFPLLAVPFFILAGALMNTGGTTERLVRLANVMVGRFTGGLGHVTIVSNMIMAGMSGSAAADAAGTGSVLIPAMKRAGFSPSFSAALTAAASTIGPIIPPSIPFVVFGVLASVSIGRLFLGGAIPGVLMGLYLMVAVYVIAKRRGYARGAPPAKGELRKALWEALPALALPAIIIWGIVGGVVTPTEAAVIAVLYALFLGTIVYRELTWTNLQAIFGEAALTTASVMFIVAAAALLAWVLTRQQAGPALVSFVLSISRDPYIVLLVLNVILLILGCFLETLSLMILLVPVLMPLIKALGIDPVHFGVMFTLNLMIGLITPPVGMSMFIACRIANIQITEFAREIGPFVLALVAVLLVVTYFPSVVLFLPNLLMGN
ncbi:MAG: TRAP transporter large permease [Alphaproteobacteria bacterium]|nr:TRAP transporter large permease [Alphaproteobacteria bacterium]